MNKNEKIYDKNGTLLHQGDVIDTDSCTLEIYYEGWYVVGYKVMWPIEEFTLEPYKDGYCLVDFEKSQG